MSAVECTFKLQSVKLMTVPWGEKTTNVAITIIDPENMLVTVKKRQLKRSTWDQITLFRFVEVFRLAVFVAVCFVFIRFYVTLS